MQYRFSINFGKLSSYQLSRDGTDIKAFYYNCEGKKLIKNLKKNKIKKSDLPTINTTTKYNTEWYYL